MQLVVKDYLYELQLPEFLVIAMLAGEVWVLKATRLAAIKMETPYSKIKQKYLPNENSGITQQHRFWCHVCQFSRWPLCKKSGLHLTSPPYKPPQAPTPRHETLVPRMTSATLPPHFFPIRNWENHRQSEEVSCAAPVMKEGWSSCAPSWDDYSPLWLAN